MSITVIDTDELIRRNAAFAAGRSFVGLTIRPRGNLRVVGCVDVNFVKKGLPDRVFVSGLAYDVATGLIEAVVPPPRVKP